MKPFLILSLLATTGITTLAYAENSKPTDKQCKATVTVNGPMAYDTQEIHINKKNCSEFTIELKNESKMAKASMGHDIVITQTTDAEGVIADGQSAGIEKNYLKEGDTRIIAHTKLTGDGESDNVTFKTESLTVGGDYTFFCSFPGHYAMMKGKVTVTE